MPEPALTTMPDTIVSGTTVTYTRSTSDYPANDGWMNTLYIAGPEMAVPLPGTPSGASYVFTLTAAVTAALDAGDYHWEERAVKAGEYKRVAGGLLTILPNIATATAGSMGTHEERMVALLTTLIEKRVGEDMSQYTIAQRQAVREDLKNLTAMRASMVSAVAQQKRPGRFGREVTASFPPV